MTDEIRRKLESSIALGVGSLLQLWLMAAVVPPRGAYPMAESMRQFHVVFLSIASLVWLQVNLWLLWRGKFRWHVEGAITSVYWLICFAITTPTLIYAT